MNDKREVVKCPSCDLTQYMTKSKDCRRCEKPLFVPPVAAMPTLPISVFRPHEEPTVDICLVFQQNVLTARRHSHLSQRQLAKRMSVPRTWISKFENQRISPTLASIQRFADAFGVPAFALLIPPTTKEVSDEEVPAHSAAD